MTEEPNKTTDASDDLFAGRHGTYHLTGKTPRNLSKVILLFLPIVVLASLAAIYRADGQMTLVFGFFSVFMGGIVHVLRSGIRKFQSVTISATGITFAPAPLALTPREIERVEVVDATAGHSIFILTLAQSRLVPYFGTVWCFGRRLVVNTE